MVTPGIIFHKSSRAEGFFTLEEMAEKGLFSGPFAHVKHYATSGFDGIRAVWDKTREGLYVILLPQHVERVLKTMDFLLMRRDAARTAHDAVWKTALPCLDTTAADLLGGRLGISRPDISKFVFSDVDAGYLAEKILETVRVNVDKRFINPSNGCYIRPNFYRDSHHHNELGVLSMRHDIVLEIAAFEWGAYLSRPPNVIVYPEGVVSPIRSHKAGANYGFAGMAKNWAVLNGFDEVLLTDRTQQRNVLEGGGENVYRVSSEGKVRTPSLDQSILPGTKRGLLVQMLRNMGVHVDEGEVPLWYFMQGRAALFSGTAAGVIGLNAAYDPVTQKLQVYNLQNEVSVIAQREYNEMITGGAIDQRNEQLRDTARTRIVL